MCTFVANTLEKMKKALLVFILNILVMSLFAQEWVNLSSSKPIAPKTVLVSAMDGKTTVGFSLEGYCINKVETPRGQQVVITVPKMASMLVEGAPDLPLFAIPVMIGDLAEMEVRVDKTQYVDVQDIEIAPSKGNFSREINPDDVPYRYGEAYEKDAFYPDFQTQLDTPYILRDCRGQNILVYPFAYNPVTKTLRVYTQLTITMHQVGNHGDNPKLSHRSSVRLSPETDAMYGQRFINYKQGASKYNFIPDEGEMMVICPEQYMEAMQPLVEWKNESGRPTTMYSVTEAGGNNAQQIKEFVRQHYENTAENLTYILLVGDYADITPYSLGGGRSDIWFGQLEGNDYYPEVFVGRFSVGSVADVEHQVAKVLYYERDMPVTADWLNKGIGIGSTEGAGSGHNGGESDYQHIDYIRDTLMHYTYAEVSQHYAGVGAGTNAAMLSQNFNEGASICNYCNHGSTTSWYVGSFSNSHINALTNDYKWPVIWSTACLNGQFSSNCFAEAWMRATNNTTGVPTGAIGGMFSWINQPWQPPMTGQDEMVNVLCEWRSPDQFHHTLAGASLNGNMKILDMHPSDQGATHNTWILFGDPSLLLRTDNPTEMNLTCQPEAIFLGQTELRITADVDYAVATLSINGNVVCCEPVINGEATLNFVSPDEVGTARLVVLAYNKVTELRDIEIIPSNGAYLTFDNFSINDANGQADYGETVSIDLTMKNIGNENAANIQVALTTDSPFVEILDGSASIPSIAVMESYTIANAFQIAVDEMIEDGTQVYFDLVCTDGSHTWTSLFRMTLHAPIFELAEFRLTGTAFPGETDTLLIGIRNVGSADAHNADMLLYSSTSDLTFFPTMHSMGVISAGNTVMVHVPFHASNAIPSGSSYEVYYYMEAEPFVFDGIELLNIGPVKETFESGDFSAFDWETIGGAYWYVDNTNANTGTFSARSGSISHANLTTLQVQVEVPESGQISFYKKVSSEANKDKLTFYIDSQAMGEWSGEVIWSRESYPVTAGTHKFKWIYMKDSSGSYGNDCCWIDDVQFPSSNTFEFLPAFDVTATLDLNEVTLSWPDQGADCDYVVRCNGTLLSTQHETTFTHWQNLGTYLYSISAVNSQNQMSHPGFAKVEVTVVGVPETDTNLILYPSPVRNWLNVSVGKPFQYAIFNSLGQKVASGEAGGAARIPCGTMTMGVYYIQIKTESRVLAKKILIIP